MYLKWVNTKGFPKHCFFCFNFCDQAKCFTSSVRLIQVRYSLPEFITNMAAQFNWSCK